MAPVAHVGRASERESAKVRFLPGDINRIGSGSGQTQRAVNAPPRRRRFESYPIHQEGVHKLMNIIEAVNALCMGKCVRNVKWNPICYLYLPMRPFPPILMWADDTKPSDYEWRTLDFFAKYEIYEPLS